MLNLEMGSETLTDLQQHFHEKKHWKLNETLMSQCLAYCQC